MFVCLIVRALKGKRLELYQHQTIGTRTAQFHHRYCLELHKDRLSIRSCIGCRTDPVPSVSDSLMEWSCILTFMRMRTTPILYGSCVTEHDLMQHSPPAEHFNLCRPHARFFFNLRSFPYSYRVIQRIKGFAFMRYINPLTLTYSHG